MTEKGEHMPVSEINPDLPVINKIERHSDKFSPQSERSR